MPERFMRGIEALNGIVWGPMGLGLLFGTGLLLTVRTGGFQLRRWGYWMRHTLGAILTDRSVTAHTAREEQAISQFQSLCTALASTIGTGNLVGVATAILSGGAGAVFWMWVMALLGMMTSYAENVLAVAVVSCQKEPSTSGLHEDYLVYTDYDQQADFSDVETFYLPDSILVIGNADKTEYWKDADAQEIIGTVADLMESRNFVRTDDKETAQTGLQISYVERVTYFVGYDYPYWWWYYPYYWAPGYWGDWLGWHYPYQVYYGYTAGSMLIEMVDLTADRQSNRKLPVIWDSFIGGLLTSSHKVNMQRTLDAVNQAFMQSPYLETNSVNR